MTQSPLASVLDAIDHINQQDPNKEIHDGQEYPKELIYGHRMTTCLTEHWPDADEQLQIAVRAQHIKRWSIPRADFEQGRNGYLKWRKAQGEMHAQLAAQLMLEHGYNDEQAAQTASVLRKEKLKSNPSTQALEDVACLVFLEHYFEPFAAKHSDEKIVSIVQKTWRKMSDKAKEIALKLTLPEHLSALVGKALG
jgi:hypothetical protein